MHGRLVEIQLAQAKQQEQLHGFQHTQSTAAAVGQQSLQATQNLAQRQAEAFAAQRELAVGHHTTQITATRSLTGIVQNFTAGFASIDANLATLMASLAPTGGGAQASPPLHLSPSTPALDRGMFRKASDQVRSPAGGRPKGRRLALVRCLAIARCGRPASPPGTRVVESGSVGPLPSLWGCNRCAGSGLDLAPLRR